MGDNSNFRWSLASDSWAGLKSYTMKSTRKPGTGTDSEMPTSLFSGCCFRSFNENQNHPFRRLILAQDTSSHRKRKLDVNTEPISDSWVSNPPRPAETSPYKNSIQARQYNVEAERVEPEKRNLLLLTEETDATHTLSFKRKEVCNEGERKVNAENARTPQQFTDNEAFNFPSRKVRGIIILNILTLIYASNIPVIKKTEAIMDPSLFTVCRFAVAAIPFIPFMFPAWRDAKVRIAGLELGFWVSAGYLTQGIGLLTSDAGRASFISAFTVIVVPLLDGLLGARIPKLTWLGAAGALLGIGLLESSGSPITIGDFWNFLSAVFFGIHMLRTEHHSRITKKDKFVALLGYEIFVIALFSAMWYLLRNDTFHLPPMNMEDIDWAGSWHKLVSLPWLPILYTGVFSTGFCLWAEASYCFALCSFIHASFDNLLQLSSYFEYGNDKIDLLQLAAMRDVSATETAIIYGLEPLWGAAFAWFLLEERWGSMGWLGAILILGGSLMVQLFGSSQEKPSMSSCTSLLKLKEESGRPGVQEVLDETKHPFNSKLTRTSRSKSSKNFRR